MELLSTHFDSNGSLSQIDISSLRIKTVGYPPLVSDGSESIVNYGQRFLQFLISSSVKSTALLARVYGKQFLAMFYELANNLESFPHDANIADLLQSEDEQIKKIVVILNFVKKTVVKFQHWESLQKDLGKLDQTDIEPILGVIDNYHLFKQNPYSVMGKNRKISFKTVDKLALSFKVPFHLRLLANLRQRLQEAVYDHGHTCYLLDSLVEECRWKAIHNDIRNCDYDFIVQFVQTQPTFILINEHVYLDSVYKIETGVVNAIANILDDGDVEIGKKELVISFIKQFENEYDIVLNNKQQIAVLSVFTGQRMFIVTGYPGTGKSSIVSCVSFVANKLQKSFVLCAPTGKASMRLGRNAQTIHRLLNIIDLDDDKPFKAHYTIKADIVIVDEVSMIDLHLAYALFNSCSPHTKILLLGDANQLPSVRYGNVLADLLKTQLIGNVKLTKIYRQQEDSSICKVARDVIKGFMPNQIYLHTSDTQFIECDDEHDILFQINHLYQPDITILIPTKKGDLGTYAINNLIHKKLFGHNSHHWMLNEKVICTKNIYHRDKDGIVDIDNSVFNGQSGAVVKLKADSFDVHFDNGIINVNKKDIDKAYAITVHKSQGSEYDTVILVLHKSAGLCLFRQLLYTAITRAKKKIYIIGSFNAFKQAVHNIGKLRISILPSRINDLFVCL